MFPLVITEAQTVEQVWVNSELFALVREQRNLCRLGHLKLKKTITEDAIRFLKAGVGVPCECGCQKVAFSGESVFKVLSPYPCGASRKGPTYYYYISLECERRAMLEMAVYVKRVVSSSVVPVTLIEKPI